MSSAHAIRLYEMIIRWRHSSSKCEIQIQDLKTALQLEKDYPRIYDLKKRVIQPSVDQINEHSDIWLKWDQRKTGRQVTHLTFKFGPKDAHIAEEKPMTKAKFAKFARPGEELKQAVERAKQEGYRFRFDPYAA